MKYSQIRIILFTLTIGLASIPFADFVQTKWIESSIELPQTESGNVVVLPMTTEEIIKAGYEGGGGGPCGGKHNIITKRRLEYKK